MMDHDWNRRTSGRRRYALILAMGFVTAGVLCPLLNGRLTVSGSWPRELISIRPGIPIILCTGFSDENDEQRARVIGVKGFIMKPVATGDLAEMVRKVLDDIADSLSANEAGQADAITPVQRQLKDHDNG